MSEPDGLICAFVLDGEGGGRPLDWDGIAAWRPADGPLWVHLDRTGERAREWVEGREDIPPAIVESLINAQGNRPRVQRLGESLLVMLRGINRVEGEHAEDMPTMHMWLTPNRVVSLRRRRLMAGVETRDAVLAGRGPRDAGEFVVQMAERLMEPMVEIFADLEDEVESLGEAVLESEGSELRHELRHVRQAATLLRRHLAPQREALTRLLTDAPGWVDDLDRSYLREIADRTTRYVEDLDAARERAAIAQEELNTRIADQMNRTMYLLTVVAALLLPPSLLTGLFGINVGGMPGVESAVSFWIVFVSIPVLAVVEFVLLRRLGWI